MPGIFALLCSWFALALIRGPAGARTALATLVIATAFVAGRVFDSGASTRYSAIAAAVALSSLAASRRDAQDRRTLLLGVALIPALTLWFALVALENELKAVRVLTAIAWAAFCIASTSRLPLLARNVGFAIAALCAGVVCPIVFDERSLELTLSLSAYSACAALAMAWLQVPGIAAGSVIWLAVATLAGYGDLAERVNYEYTPFMTLPSLGALAYSIACVTFHLLRQLREHQPYRVVEELVGIATAIAVFAWGRQELAGAFSPDAAVFALIVYYALFGVALIYVGGLRESLHMRPAGLVLSVYAALKAFFEASQLDIGFRVGAFLLSGIFLLAVAYWYQRSMPLETTGAAREPHARVTG